MTLRRRIFILFIGLVIAVYAQKAGAQEVSDNAITSGTKMPFMTSRVFNPMLFQPVSSLMNQNALVANGNAGYVSNTVDVKLLKAIYNSEFISKTELDRVYNRNENNFVTTDLSVTAGATFGSDSSKLKHGLYLQWRNQYTLNLSKGLSGLVYYGNALFENETVSMDGDLSSRDYRRLQYVLTFDVSPALKLSGSAGFVQASQLSEAEMEGSVFTATDGDFLDLDYNFDIRTYKASGKLDMDARGFVFGASALYHQPDGRDYFIVGLQEAGFISAPSSSRRYKADNTVTFDGFFIGDVFALNDSSFVNLDEDSIRRYLGVNETREMFNAGIPARLFVRYQHDFERGWSLGFESDYAPAVYKSPYAAVHASRWWNTFFYTGVFLHTSTFNTINTGLSLALNIYTGQSTDRYFQVKAQSGYLNALVAPKQTKGLDGLVEVSYRF